MSQKRLLGLFLTLSLAVLSVVLLAVIACSADTGVYVTKLDPEAVPKELDINDGVSTSVMNAELANVAVSKLTIKNSGDLTAVQMDAPLTVPADKELVLGANVRLIVPEAITVAINGRLRVADGAVLDFRAIQADSAALAAAVTLSGTITVEAGGSFYGPPIDPTDPADPNTPPLFQYKGTGKVVLEYGSIAHLQISEANYLNIGPSADITGYPIFEWYDESGGSIELTQGLITLMSGHIEANGLDMGGAVVPIQKVVIETVAVLKIAAGLALQVNGSLVVYGTLVAEGTIIGAADDVMLTFGSTAQLSGTGIENTANFYESGSTPDPDQEAAVVGKTYRWDSSLAGGTGGWKTEGRTLID
jgi:hypothetical protein